MTGDDRGALLHLQERTADVVSAFTGVRQQFIDQGWTDRGAEAMAVEVFRVTNRPQP